MIGQDVPFITSSQITTDGQVINTIQYQSIGIILDVTPHINPDGLVIMDVVPTISAISDSTVPISETVNAAVFSKRSATTRVAINDGQTIVIGGLMQDQKDQKISRVPVIGHIPLIGTLFSHTVEDKAKTELLIFLTPHVAREPGDLKGMSEDEMQGTQIVPNAVSPGTFQDHMKGMQRGGHPQAPAQAGVQGDSGMGSAAAPAAR